MGMRWCRRAVFCCKPMSATPIRRLVPTDAAQYRALMLEAYTLAPDAFTSSVTERAALPLTWWEARVAQTPDAKEVVWGVFADGVLAGVAGLAFEQRERTAHKASLFGMYVRPDGRGQGMAHQLVAQVLDHAAQSGVNLVQLTVTESNTRAVRLYTRCGFIPFGTEPYAVRLGPQFLTKLHMWRLVGDGLGAGVNRP